MKNTPWYLERTIKAVDEWIDYKRVYERVPGIAVGITYKGETIFTKGYGYSDMENRVKMTPDTLIRVASNSKMFTATAVMQLKEKGKLDLEDKVQKYLPWFKSDKDKNMNNITIYNLLTHSAGIERDGDTPHWNDDNFPGIERVKKHVEEGISNYPPYERFKYSNYGFSFLGEIVKVVGGIPYEDYVSENILKPLGLSDTYPDYEEKLESKMAVGYDKDYPGRERKIFKNTKTNFFASATGFVSNVNDMCKFLSAQKIGNGLLLTDESKRNMQKVHFSMDIGDFYGMGYEIWRLGRRQVVGHGGGYAGYRTKVAMDKKENINVVVLTNMMDGPAISVLNAIYRTIYHLKENEKDYGIKEKIQGNLKLYEGLFTKRWGDAQIVAVGKYLVLFWMDNSFPFEYTYKLENIKGTEFKIISGNDMGSIGEKARFDFNQKGKLIRAYIGPNSIEKVDVFFPSL